MRWLKRDMWKLGIALAGLLLFLVFMVWVPVSASAHRGTSGLATPGTVQATPTVDTTMTALQKEQLTQQVDQGQRTWGNWLWNNGTALLSTLVVVVGALIGFLRWLAGQQRALVDRRDALRKELADRQAARDIAADNQGETAFQTYIDKMSELLLKEDLLRSQPGNVVREIARVRTLTILSQLDPTRKKSVLRFLYESDLILTHNTIVDLHYVKLQGADLHRATFNGINLSKSNLRYADLSESELDQADLNGAKLEGANLNQASLVGANLSGILDFEQVKSMKSADLRRVKGLTRKQLEACKAKGAIVDEDTMTSAPQTSATLPSPQDTSTPNTATPSAQAVALPVSQVSDAQAPSATPAQASTPLPSTDGGTATSTQPSVEP